MQVKRVIGEAILHKPTMLQIHVFVLIIRIVSHYLVVLLFSKCNKALLHSFDPDMCHVLVCPYSTQCNEALH